MYCVWYFPQNIVFSGKKTRGKNQLKINKLNSLSIKGFKKSLWYYSMFKKNAQLASTV